MKQIKSRWLFLCLLCYSTVSFSQTYTIGENDGTNSNTTFPTPFGDYFKTTRCQFLYLNTELTDAGMTAGYITELIWNVDFVIPTVTETEDYTIKILSTATNSLDVPAWEAGAMVVWGPTDYTPVAGLNEFDLETPFYWDGVSNLIIEVCGGSNLGNFSKNARVTWSGPLAFNGSHTYASDTDPDVCDYTGTEIRENTNFRPQIQITQGTVVICDGMPDAGLSFTSATEVCEEEYFTLSVNSIPEVGIMYQWESSADGTTWNSIPDASANSYLANQNSDTYYHCIVTCTNSGLSDTSSQQFITMKDILSCYCQPVYGIGNGLGDYISNVTLESINNTTGQLATPYYFYYNDLTANLEIDSTYNLYVTVGSYDELNGFAAWIDLNIDGEFDEATEKIGEVVGLGIFETGLISFTIPAGATLGDTRIRIREAYNVVGMHACNPYDYGEAEDYSIHLQFTALPVTEFNFAGDPYVSFVDLTDGYPSAWSWDFGDGGTSDIQNPEHLFETNGTYHVCLTSTNVNGSAMYCENVVIDSYLPPIASFNFSGDPEVTFTDLSSESPTSWLWDFGDGITSTEQNPVHTFLENNTYYVCLTAENEIGSNTTCQYVLIESYAFAPVADFTYFGDPTTYFVDFSTHIPTNWYWDFGDGGSSIEQNPSHTYTSNGTYIVCLTAGNDVGSDTHCQTIVINGYPTTVASYTYSGDPEVIFTDLSSNSPSTWFWDFADGTYSTEQNPAHTFTSNSVYNVCLTAGGAGGSDTYCDNIEINSAQLAPVSDFYTITSAGLTIEFYDASTNIPTEWSWDFGDGSVSLLQNPVHIYENADDYLVCLTATNVVGSDEICKLVNVTTSINTVEFEVLNIFPNPANETIDLILPHAVTDFSFDIQNMLGEIISDREILQLSENHLQIPVNDLPAGNYLISLHAGGTLYTGRFSKL